MDDCVEESRLLLKTKKCEMRWDIKVLLSQACFPHPEGAAGWRNVWSAMHHLTFHLHWSQTNGKTAGEKQEHWLDSKTSLYWSIYRKKWDDH